MNQVRNEKRDLLRAKKKRLSELKDYYKIPCLNEKKYLRMKLEDIEKTMFDTFGRERFNQAAVKI